MFFFNCALTKKREIPAIARVVSSRSRLRFGGERKRKRERRSSLFFFVRRAFGTTVFHRFWSGARAGFPRDLSTL